MTNGTRERPEPPAPRIIDQQLIEPRNQRIIEERRSQRYRTTPQEISIIENGHETFRTTIPTGKFR